MLTLPIKSDTCMLHFPSTVKVSPHGQHSGRTSHVFHALIVFVVFSSKILQTCAEDHTCVPPVVDEANLPADFCKVLRQVCLHQDALVSYDPAHYASYNPETNRSELRSPVSYLPTWTSSWNIPGAMNSDAIVGNQDAATLHIRPATRLESHPALQQQQQHHHHHHAPAFSRCTLPVLLLADWPFNFGEFFANGASTADLWFRVQRRLPGKDVTLALALPAGLSPSPFHQALLGHLSSRPVTSLERMAAEAEMAAHGGGAARLSWSHDGVPRACFMQVVVCKLQGTHESSPLQTAAAVAAHLDAVGGPLPADPLGFGASGDRGPHHGSADAAAAAAAAGPAAPPALPSLDDDSTLRVAIEARHGGVRSLLNLHQLVDHCNRVPWTPVGSFRRVACRPLITYDTPQLSGLDRFRATAAAVRSSHVLVAVHGAGATNGFFLTPVGGTAAAVLEVRPCGFGSGFPWWVDVHMAINLPRLGDKVRFHAYNIEDPTQCSPSDWELAVRQPAGGVNTRAGGGHFARDQHLTLRPDGLMAMVRHVGSLLRNPEAYAAAKAANELHGYALPGEPARDGGLQDSGGGGGGDAGIGGGSGSGGGGGGATGDWGRSGGVILGPLGFANFSQHVSSGSAKFLLPPG
ncbi:hypothetical protein PLESTB_000894600 [Pleodorina starrii]|uniref:Uncharacterized protein n=1 Tax=Pleodorina starrii TaxID=330485 RepID=A0A9W6BMF1_9CHLO|nr:hypothetical protein PLESTM_000886400 [Pleodorina starrii]GLC54678.1 hypothetical protein PLESTB_000894600 [Pleodorina starrii]GLC67016.1 hypothetical protein PLESTF_000502400 [Pleodorina starrii]